MENVLHPILLVDDEKDNLEALQRLLRGLFQVTAVQSPTEALQLLPQQNFHVIVSDQRMPSLSGVEFLEKAKKLSPHSTRILLTGYTDIESVIDAINRGHIYRYISKPWDPVEFKLILQQADEAYLIRKQLEEKNIALQNSLSQLSLLDKAKAKFLSLVSHELNTPLTVLQSFMSLISQSQTELSEDLKKSVSALSKAVDRFSEIIHEVLTYTRLESSQTLNLKEVSFNTSLVSLIASFKCKYPNKNLSWDTTQVSISENQKELKLDWEKMGIALEKILDSVAKRASASEVISVSFATAKNSPVLSISWKGEGLPQEAFKPFETGQSEMHHHQNLGLSLAIAKLIIESHGGKIEFDSSSAKENKLSIQLNSASSRPE